MTRRFPAHAVVDTGAGPVRPSVTGFSVSDPSRAYRERRARRRRSSLRRLQDCPGIQGRCWGGPDRLRPERRRLPATLRTRRAQRGRSAPERQRLSMIETWEVTGSKSDQGRHARSGVHELEVRTRDTCLVHPVARRGERAEEGPEGEVEQERPSSHPVACRRIGRRNAPPIGCEAAVLFNSRGRQTSLYRGGSTLTVASPIHW